jgi:hypothetical protein
MQGVACRLVNNALERRCGKKGKYWTQYTTKNLDTGKYGKE